MKHVKSKSLYFVACCLSASLLFSCKSNSDAPPHNDSATQPATAAANPAADSLQAEYNRAKTQIDALMTQRSQMDSQLAIKNREIAQVKNKLKHEQKNARLYAAKLKTEKKLVAKLTDEARAYADRISNLQSQNNMLVAERDSLMRQYVALKQLGSVLHASGIRMYAIHLKHHGTKEKNTVKARKVNVLRIYFNIDENRIAEDGTKQLYLVITGPDGQLLGDNNLMAGMMDTHDGKAVKYTVMKEIPLQKGAPVKDIEVNWKQQVAYKKGVYNIDIYNGGYKIGSGNVHLI